MNINFVRCNCGQQDKVELCNCIKDVLRTSVCAACYEELLKAKNELVIENQELRNKLNRYINENTTES
jgi:hypothetical protein